MTESHTKRWSELKEKGGMLPLMLMLCFYRFGGRFLCKLVLPQSLEILGDNVKFY